MPRTEPSMNARRDGLHRGLNYWMSAPGEFSWRDRSVLVSNAGGAARRPAVRVQHLDQTPSGDSRTVMSAASRRLPGGSSRLLKKSVLDFFNVACEKRGPVK